MGADQSKYSTGKWTHEIKVGHNLHKKKSEDYKSCRIGWLQQLITRVVYAKESTGVCTSYKGYFKRIPHQLGKMTKIHSHRNVNLFRKI